MFDKAVEIENVKVQFGSHVALNNINFTISKGDFVSVVGPNGGGKSTLLKVLLGLININSGNIKIFSEELKNLQPNIIGYVPQIKTLDRTFPAIPIELVATGISSKWTSILNKKLKNQSLEALERVGALHLAKRQLSKLSGGELQRIYLARSIVRNPKLLLLDEPATGIDQASEKDLNKLIDDYNKEEKTTVIMVTHDWESAYHHADFVLLINCEQICFEKPEIAFNDNNLRRAFGHIGHTHDMNFGARENG
jgi:zinc transport system ATP-binding protein